MLRPHSLTQQRPCRLYRVALDGVVGNVDGRSQYSMVIARERTKSNSKLQAAKLWRELYTSARWIVPNPGDSYRVTAGARFLRGGYLGVEVPGSYGTTYLHTPPIRSAKSPSGIPTYPPVPLLGAAPTDP